MRQIARLAWCILLVLAAMAVVWLIVPKVILTFKTIRWKDHASFLARYIAGGFQGIGLIFAAWMILLSLWPWKYCQIKRSARISLAVLGIILILGAAAVAAIELWDMGFTFYSDYIEFVLAIVFAAAPVLLRGTGYLAIIDHAWKRSRRDSRPL